jgi:lysyl-tRNA synthetase class 2
MSENERQTRIEKAARLREAGIPCRPERFDRSHTLAEAAALPEGTPGLRLAGRLAAIRSFGKLTFAHLLDRSGTLQIALDRNTLDERAFRLFHELVDRGDFLGAEGPLFRTKMGELTLRVERFTFLGKALRPLPEKWHGLQDTELRQRRRYLDLVMSPETRERFRTRTRIVRTLRSFLDANGFEEVDTPVLQTVPSGAAARPFLTHHNALDMPVYLRISPETWLKRLVVGGYEKVYEFARSFRNEGMDPSHLQDFTILEYYCAYWNWEDNLRFTERLVRHLIQEVCGSLRLSWRGRELDFSGTWPRHELGALVKERTGIEIDAHPSADSLRTEIRARKIPIEKMDALGRGNLIDALYKQTVRDGLVQPCFLTGIPAETLPLARRNDARPHLADCFQLLVNGWEIVKAYSELVDPLEQRAQFEAQEKARAGGDEEAMFIDEDYLLAMEHGMPPISGWGMGLERMCALLTNSDSLREVTLFPLLRPEGAPGEEAGRQDTSAEIPDWPITREEAMRLFRANVTTEYLTKHCLASAAVMEAVAERFGKNRDAFWCIGLLHDLDFDRIKEPDRHTRETVRLLREAGVRNEAVLKAVLAHNAEGLKDVERTAWLDYALSCSETITGLILATSLIMPDRKLASVEAASVLKRMKKKDFARQVSREAIQQCEKIGLPLEEFAALALAAMQRIAPQLGA